MADKINISETELFEWIAAYLANALPEEKSVLLEKWIQTDSAVAAIFNDCKKTWDASASVEMPDFDTEEAWNSFESKMNETPVIPLYKKIKISAVAASFIAIITIALWLFNSNDSKELALVYQTKDSAQVFVLSDSSIVTLAANSVLTIDADYNNEERKMSLKGKGYFDVKSDKSRPFIVESKYAITTVKGTKFSIDTEDSLNDKLVVDEGLVAFEDKLLKQKVEVAMGEKVSADAQHPLIKSKVKSKNDFSWKTNKLSFDNATMAEVVSDLETYFEVKIQIAQPQIETCLFTGTFDQPQLQQIFELIEITTNSNVLNSNDVYIIKGNGCQ